MFHRLLSNPKTRDNVIKINLQSALEKGEEEMAIKLWNALSAWAKAQLMPKPSDCINKDPVQRRFKLKDGFARLDPEHILFKQLAKQQPVWWQNICKNTHLYIDVRKNNSLDVYYNGGKIIDLSYSKYFQGSIHFKYIPVTSKNNYVPFLFSEGTIGIDKDKLDFIDLDNFSPEKMRRFKNSSVIIILQVRRRKYKPNSY